MDYLIEVPGIELGNSENPKVVRKYCNADMHDYGITISPVLILEDNKAEEPAIGDYEFVILFRTLSSINSMIEALEEIKCEFMKENIENG